MENCLVNGKLTFGQAVAFLKQGKAVSRSGWNGNGMFVVKQVPSHIGADIIPNMQSLPQQRTSSLDVRPLTSTTPIRCSSLIQIAEQILGSHLLVIYLQKIGE